MEIKIQDELTSNHKGVYKIVFEDTGHFYFGSAVDLRRRILGHIASFRRGFDTVVSLKPMAAYKGVVRFELIALCKGRTEQEMKEMELLCIKIGWLDALCLNKYLNPGGCMGRW